MSRFSHSLLPACRSRILAGSIAAILTIHGAKPSHAADIVKDNNTNALNSGTSWFGGTLPGASDIAVWNSTVTVPNTAQIGGDLTLQGIRITDVGGPRNGSNIITIGNSGTNNNSTFTLTLGSAGIDMSTATQTLMIQSKITLAADQTWNITNANTSTNPATLNQNEDLAPIAQAANTPMNLGGFTLTKTGTGTVAFSSGWNISNGTFKVDQGVLHIQGGASRVTTVNNNVNFTVNNGATLRFAAQSGAGGISTQVNSPITLNTGSTFALHLNQANAVNLAGTITAAGDSIWNPFGGGASTSTFSGNLVGSGNITFQNTLTNTTAFLRFTGDNSGYSGTLTVNGASGNRALRLAGSNSGSSAATWEVAAANTLQVDGITVSLGTIKGVGTITNSHATNPATINVGAGTFTGTLMDGAAPLFVNKVGPGTLELLGSNFHTGTTTVSAGTLYMAPDLGAGTSVTVSDGAAFGVRLGQFGGTLNVPNLTTGTTTGSTLIFDLGSFGNPAAAGMNVGNLTINAPTKLQILAAGLTPGTFPVLDYGTIGGLGVAGVTLVLPPRTTGSLVSNTANTSFDVVITGKDAPKWTGAANGIWDVDSGNGTGTANWKEIVSGSVTKYLEGVNGSDTVLFDDSATGTTTVNLSSTLKPGALTVNNTQLTYTFTGTGGLTGPMRLSKSGTGTLVIANSGSNDYSGGTVIDGGTLQIGDGTTAGAGSLGTGSVDLISGTLTLNRPDDFSVPGIISGNGQLIKNGASTATLTARPSLTGPVTLNGGSLRLSAGGDLGGVISGSGSLVVAGGTVILSGAEANTFTGAVNITGGVLQLVKSFGIPAVSNNITISGTGQLQSTSGDQIPDTVTITYNSDGTNSVVGSDVIANAVLNPVAPGATGTGQLIVHTGLIITDTLTINGRIFAVASGHSSTVNRVNMSAGILRIAANSSPSTLDIGPGGITASGGVIEVGNGTGAFDAVLNLGGNLTTTGNLEINRGGFTGAEKREINLGDASRTFSIAQNTTTNVRPEIAGNGGLIKTGGGTLNLLGIQSYLGPTNVNEGTLFTSTTQSGTPSITVADSATLGIRVASPDTGMNVPSVNLGTSTGSNLTIDFGTFGNSSIAPLTTNALTVNGTTNLTIRGTTTAGRFPLIDYQGAIGGTGFPSFTLKLPLRVAGQLVSNTANTAIDLQIFGVDTPKWMGNVSADWDVDDGTGTGTANWKTAFSSQATRYLQGAGGTDSVVFDDSATGSAAVNLTSALTPGTVTVNNASRSYEFAGTGKLSGSTQLIKKGTGTLTIKTAADYTGGTNIEAGTVDIGGGTNGGTLGTGPITNNGTLVLNRSGNFTISSVISGTGSIIKRSATNDATLGAANVAFDGPISVQEGRLSVTNVNALGAGLKNVTVSNGAALYYLTGTTTATIFSPLVLSGAGAFNETTGALRIGANNLTFGGTITLAADASIGVDSGQTATINGMITGPGALTKSGPGTLTIAGFESTTRTSLTNVSAGTLQMNNPEGLDALAGEIAVNGGTLSWQQPHQLADTASITVNSGAINTGNRADKIANLTINAATPVSTFSGLEVTNTVTVTAGTHDMVNSSGVMTAGKVVLSNSTVRLGLNSGPSILNIGAGGLTMTDATLQYGSAGNSAQVGLVNLGGNLTASGTNLFDINTGNPTSQLDLGDMSRIFDILFGVTTVEPGIQSATPTSGVIKSGTGSLVLRGNNTYTGDTVVQGGTLDIRGSLAGSANILVKAGAILDVLNAPGGFRLGLNQTLKGTGTIQGPLAIDGTLSPGEGLGTLQFTGNLTLAGTAVYEVDKNGLSLSSDLANVSGLLTLGGTLNIAATGAPLANGDLFNLFDATSFAGSFATINLPSLNPGLFWDTSKLSLDGTLAVVPEPGSAALLSFGVALVGMRRRRRP